SYITPPTTTADSGSTFSCVVSNTGGSVTSRAALLTVTGGGSSTTFPQIDVQPADRTIASGGHVVVSLVASGAQPLNFQWYMKGPFDPDFMPMIGGGSPSFDTGILFSATQYYCTVSNFLGSVDSRIVTVSVGTNPPPPPPPPP